MLFRKFPLLLAAGAVLLFSGVAISQPVFAPPVNVGPPINTASHEGDPFLTVDGKKLYFVSLRDNTLSIWSAERSDTGWAEPVKLGLRLPPYIRHYGRKDLWGYEEESSHCS